MNYTEFSDTFLPQLASDYLEGRLPFHALVDMDLWKRIFPDMNAAPGQVQWYNIKLTNFSLNDVENTLLITYSLPERRDKNEAKFIGMRINNMQQTLNFYLLRRPSNYDDLWNLFQYDFKNKQEIFIKKIEATDSLFEFKNCIERLPNSLQTSHTESFFSYLKNRFDPRALINIAVS